MLSKLKAYVVRKREIYSQERFKEKKKPLTGLQCVKNICRLKVKVIKNKKRKKGRNRVWWYTPLIPMPGRQRHIDLCDFKGQR